jgi:hypothetical protein
MTEQGKKVWKELENMGWSNEPKDFHLEYFEDIIEATKKALTLTDVVKSLPNKYCPQCGEPIKKPHKFWCESKS